MTKIHSILSDVDLEKELAMGLKKRVIDQKFHYMNEGAMNYYTSMESRKTRDKKLYDAWTFIDQSQEKYYKPQIENQKTYKNNNIQFCYDTCKTYFDLWSPIAVISLWCGNAMEEKALLERLTEDWYSFEYYGVDSSKSMLELADQSLKDINIPKYLIHGDIMTEEFREEIKKMTAHITIRIFTFLWGTFINPNQTEITESLYNMMWMNDVLRTDMLVRDDDNEQNNELVYSRYLNFLNDETIIDKFFFPLQKVWITLEDWIIEMVCEKEDQVWALLFKYYFTFNKKRVISYRNEILCFLEKDVIIINEIRKHHLDTFLHFMKKHGFMIASKHIKTVDFLSRAHLFFIKKELIA